MRLGTNGFHIFLHRVVDKSGTWFSYGGERLGQGKENARKFMLENPDIRDEIEKKIMEKLQIGADVTATDDAAAPVEF